MSDVRGGGGGGLHNFDLNAENDDQKPIRLQMSSCCSVVMLEKGAGVGGQIRLYIQL